MACDGAGALVTNGAHSGIDGGRFSHPFATAFAAAAVSVAAFQALTIIGALHDLPPGRSPWPPVINEGSSGVAVVALFLLIWQAAVRFPPGRPWLRFAIGHVAVNGLFCALHIAFIVPTRMAGYALIGRAYSFGGWPSAVYEYRRDILVYAVMVAAALTIRRLATPATPVSPAGSPAPAPTFDIRDGARILRTPLGDILAISAAGNYAQFHLADGRTPLMRATLAALEQELAAQGFVRTHRSWLINPVHVRAVEPEGSGDYRLALTGGAAAPLSRRFPAARAALKVST